MMNYSNEGKIITIVVCIIKHLSNKAKRKYNGVFTRFNGLSRESLFCYHMAEKGEGGVYCRVEEG